VPSPHAAPVDVLATLVEVLSTLRVPWYVFGAQAAVIWGRPRLTADIDITVRLGSEETGRLVRALEDHGFRLRSGDAADLVRHTRVLPFVHTASELPVDVVLAGPGLEELFLARAVEVTVGTARVPVISPEDLIATKILAGRAKDLEDVQGVLRERGANLDLDSIRSTLTLLEEALGQSDLRPLFEHQLARVAKTGR
jgi:hypothetical protein